MNRDSLNPKDKLYRKIWRHCNNPLGDNKHKFGCEQWLHAVCKLFAGVFHDGTSLYK